MKLRYGDDAHYDVIKTELFKRGWVSPEDRPIVGKVKARIDHGRWLADCLECNGAELVAPDCPMVCVSCNAGAFQVEFPDRPDDIEDALLSRPPQHQNWEGEPVTALREENRQRGVA